MNRQHLSYALSLLMVVSGLAFAGSAFAQDQTPSPVDQPENMTPPDPQDVADRFVENTWKLGHLVVTKNGEAAENAVAHIEALIEQGRLYAARHVARESIQRINRISRTATTRIRYHARRTLGVLHQLEADDALMQKVKETAQRQQRRIVRSCSAATRQISMAVGDLHVAVPRPDEVE